MAFDKSLARLCRDAVYEIGREQSNGYDIMCPSVNPTVMLYHIAKRLVTPAVTFKTLMMMAVLTKRA